MSGHSTYNPTNPVMKWVDDRLPLPRLMYDSFVTYPVPRNLNYWYTFGGILMIMMVSQIITGIVLVMHYTPHVDMAFDSVEHIRRNVNFGNVLQKWHAVGASFFFIAVYIHIARGMYYGSYKAPREILWMLGVAIFLVMMATGFMGYVLPWGQMSFWGAKVITNLFSAVPFFGEAIVTWLWGGFSVDNATLQRFFSLHYLLPFVLVGVVILHVWALHVTGQGNPTGVEVKSGQDTLAFTPFATVKDAFALSVFFIVFTAFVFFAPDYLGHSINYEEANPLVTPEHIVPEWYYLPFYAILRAVPDKLLGVVAMFGSILVWFILPWLDTSKVRSATYRPIFKQLFWLLMIDFFVLGVVGANPPEGWWITVGQIATVYYFAHFLILLPLVGLLETPKPLPSSISDAVLAKNADKQPAAQPAE
ncbi:cytochrome b N-terminal domain-containing protein [Anderseniella sp. Alg231-50]|uniref:cytochrome b N-terminal domain-containing protein n=1 Tax=Anderseniella sp. Alg231-50 TaxID=1922226 RepID=UPI000D559ABF